MSSEKEGNFMLRMKDLLILILSRFVLLVHQLFIFIEMDLDGILFNEISSEGLTRER